MLHSLQHPCIVSLVGISIHPLCFALQLAPLGSLNTVLEEKRKGKWARFPPGRASSFVASKPRSRTFDWCSVAGSAFMPLGHMLTFKVAYQIAAGLAYLHRKSIIFCDLKSDNILVWSLEVSISNMQFSMKYLYITTISPDLSVYLLKLLLWLFLLQERDGVNIKLSDYGISRQSFHEGVLGVEGTPGYQAPEVRPGIVYDEKVQGRFHILVS